MCADVVNHIDKIPRLHIVVLCRLRFILKPSLVSTQFHTVLCFHAHRTDVPTCVYNALGMVQIEPTSFLSMTVPFFQASYWFTRW
nr:MAG TPA: hypothetical protein [Caudoviricetes sp.]